MLIRTGFVIAVFGAVLVSADSSARTFLTQTFTCPLTRTRFQANVEASGTQFCQRLDLKPIGPIGAPGLVPECPDDGLVLYRETFTRDELKVLRPWVQSEHYQKFLRQESTYFRVAETMKQLGGAADDVGWSYVLASWQVEDQPERYGRYVSAAIAALTQGAEQRATSPDKDARPAAARLRILAAELSRRMGLLPQAEQLLEAARPALDVLPDGDRQWHAAVHARVEARFTGNGYFEDDDVVCANLDGER